MDGHGKAVVGIAAWHSCDAKPLFRILGGQHMKAMQVAAAEGARPLTTEELAAEVKALPQSIRKRYSQTGSYWGIRPVKLPNGRLLWPADALQRLMEGE